MITRCPTCAVPLRASARDAATARCPRCDGVLTSTPEVARAARITRESTTVCPACAGLMDAARAGAADLSLCARCGVAWLDARAVDALAAGSEPALAALGERERTLGRRLARG